MRASSLIMIPRLSMRNSAQDVSLSSLWCFPGQRPHGSANVKRPKKNWREPVEESDRVKCGRCRVLTFFGRTLGMSNEYLSTRYDSAGRHMVAAAARRTAAAAKATDGIARRDCGSGVRARWMETGPVVRGRLPDGWRQDTRRSPQRPGRTIPHGDAAAGNA